jgi:hypothetical protein
MLLRLLLILILVMVAISIIRGLIGMLHPAQRDRVPGDAERLVRDPVCGTYVSPQSALSARSEFFCSEECRSRFLTGKR